MIFLTVTYYITVSCDIRWYTYCLPLVFVKSSNLTDILNVTNRPADVNQLL